MHLGMQWQMHLEMAVLSENWQPLGSCQEKSQLFSSNPCYTRSRLEVGGGYALEAWSGAVAYEGGLEFGEAAEVGCGCQRGSGF